jgi:plasmid stabilization system protein ParE
LARVLWTLQAAADLESVPVAVRDRVLARVGLLGEFPMMGPAMDGPYEGFRQLVVARHRVIYQIGGAEVRIAYIRHGARQLGLRTVRGRG